MRNIDIIEAYRQKEQEEQLLARGNVCREFRASAMYKLLSQILEDMEGEALEEMQTATPKDDRDASLLLLRWQERRWLRKAIQQQIDSYIQDATELTQVRGIDRDEFELRSEIENG